MLKSDIEIPRTKFLFIISHMRSRSSLLSHLLGSNSEIAGYTELHQSYYNRFLIYKQKKHIVRDTNIDVSGKYLFDKLLHNQYIIPKKMLRSNNVKLIFLLREPESTLRSIINLGYMTNTKRFLSPKKVTQYYCNRLAGMVSFSQNASGNGVFINSDQIINDQERVLNGLTEWLSLKTVLKAHYNVFPKTGIPGYGDPSEVIKSGVISSKRPVYDARSQIEIPEQAKNAYSNCVKNLQQNCSMFE